MKLLFLATYFPDAHNPSRGNWALEQARAFAQAGIEVTVVVPTPWVPRMAGILHPKLSQLAATPRETRMEGLTVHFCRWPFYPWNFLGRLNRLAPRLLPRLAWFWLRPALARLVRECQPEAILAHHTLVCGQVALALHKRYRLPYVVTDHEVGDLIACGESPAIQRVFNDVGSSARQMTVVSKAMERIARRNVPSVDFSTIYNGTSAPVFDRHYGPSNSGPVIVLCCAKFYGRKDIPLLIRAFDKVVEAGDNASLRIGGDGPDREKIRSCLAACARPDRISLLGLLSPVEVRKEMEGADIFALVGWAEPFGVVFLEAMAAGLPIVVSRDAGVAEVLTDGEDAVFTEPRDQASVELALRELIKDGAARERIGLAGSRLLAAQFTWAHVVQEYMKFLDPKAEQHLAEPD